MEKVTEYQQIVDAILKAMAVKGITQKVLADALGIHQPQLNRVLKAKNSPSIDLVFLMLNYLDVQVGIVTPVQ
jgi:transcriptional regulator with XRE-family HTH domain